MTNSPPSSEFYRPRLGQAAGKGLLVVCKCYVCRRTGGKQNVPIEGEATCQSRLAESFYAT